MLDLVSRWVGCAAIVMGIGCGLDVADTGHDGSPEDTDEPASTDWTTAGAGETGDDTDPAGTGDGGERPRGCDTLACGDGTCELDDDGKAVCVCFEGYASIGYECVPCNAYADGIGIDLGLIDITGTITINGQEPPKNVYEYGDVYLRNPITGDEVFLASTHAGEYTATVLPGTYDLYFAKRAGGEQVPANQAGFIRRQVVDNDAPIHIDIPTTTVIGTIRFGDEAPPANPYDRGRIFLRNGATSDEVTLAHTDEQDYLANVLPGEYTIHYQVVASQGIAPANLDAQIGFVDVPALDEILVELDVVVPVVQVQGTITLAGATPPDNPYNYGRILFVDRLTASTIEVAKTSDGQYTVPLATGAYDVFYERSVGDMPLNKRARLHERLEIDASQTLDVDIPVSTVSVNVTVDGQIPPTSTSDDGVIRLHDPQTGDVIVLGHTRHGSFSRTVVPGTYEVRYAQATAGATMPGNLDAKIEDVTIAPGSDEISVNIAVVDIKGTITVNGAPPPTSEYSDGRLYLRNQSGDSVLLGNTRLGAFDARVVPGLYDIVYVVETTGDGVPLNGAAVLGVIDVAQTQDLAIDVPLVRMNGPITIAGQTPPGTPYDYGTLFLQDVASHDRIFLGDTRKAAYGSRVTAGQYLVGYRIVHSSGLVPQNTDALLECITVAD